jgi:hypothetical protein
MLKRMTPMLETDQLDGTVRFWSEILGFAVEAYQKDDWAKLSKDGLAIMFSTPNAHRNFEKSNLTGSIYFETEAVDDVWNDIKEKVKVCYDIETFDYGMREFGFYDNNEYLIQFGQDDETL